MLNTINIFPLSNAGTGNDGNKLTEGNIASLITAMSSPDHQNFVVNATINADNKCEAIKFVMQGRFFDIAFDSPYLDLNNVNGEDINAYYAHIYISDEALTPFSNSGEASSSIDLQVTGESVSDSETNSSLECFIKFDKNQSNDVANYTLQLLEKLPDGTLRVPISSQFQLKGNRIANINGGTV